MKINKSKALETIKEHGWKSGHEQTAVLNGEFVESGSSFFEALGNKAEYILSDIAVWLGY